MDRPLYDGETIVIAGRTFVAPPLCLRDFKRVLGKMASLETLPPDEAMDVMTDAIYSSLARNAPDLTRDELEGLLDVPTLGPLAMRIIELSGGKKKTEPPPPNPSTGTDSTPS